MALSKSGKKAEPAAEPVEAEPEVKTEKVAKAAEDDVKIATWARTTTKAVGIMQDPKTGVRISKLGSLVGSAPKEGSWLDCQIKAGLVVLYKGPG